jgi:hypothetical protein
VPEHYDDGRFLRRHHGAIYPATAAGDVQAAKVDIIVACKFDRLTRVLSDFAKIVEVLDNKSASFVSVTQALDTTTGMSRQDPHRRTTFNRLEPTAPDAHSVSNTTEPGFWKCGDGVHILRISRSQRPPSPPQCCNG